MTEGVRSASNRLYTLATRATLSETPDDKQLFQEVTAHGFAGEVHTAVEHPTSYGFSHVPIAPTGKQAAEIFMVYLGASRSNPVAVLIGDRRYRMGNMSEGDVAHHTRSTQQSHFIDGKGHVRSAPNSHYHRHQVMQEGDKVSGGLNPIAPFASGQTPWAAKTPHSYKHSAAAQQQSQHPKQINHHIISGPAIPPNISSALTSMSGLAGQIGAMAGQIGTMATAGVGVPGINALGSQISALVSQITGTGVTPSMGALVGQIATYAATSAGATSTTGIAAIAARIQSLTASLQSMMGGGMSQIIHKSEHALASGLLHSVFQGKHATQHGLSGIVAQSIAQIAHNAPMIPHNGNSSVSDQLTVSKDVLSPLYNVLSDRRIKTNVVEHESILEKVLTLKVKRFDVSRVNYHPNLKTMKFEQRIHGDAPTPSHGLIAQEVREVFPALVHGDEAQEFLSISEHKIGILVLHAFQEFVRETRAEIKKLKAAHA